MAHIWLVGMMGSGKTTVGAIVAESRDMPLEDSDTLVMERTGRTIPDLFTESEAVFRAAEVAVVTDLANAEPSVISTGGGVVLDAGNVAAMRDSGSVILLDADTRELEHRLAGDLTRPLLVEDDALSRIATERRDAYAAASHHRIDTTGKTPNQVAEEVLSWLDT